jgi:flavodoxin
MKARVKATGNIVDVKWYGHNSMGSRYADITNSSTYYEYELDFDTVYDYWDKLKHQYAGMAMQGLILTASKHQGTDKEVAQWAEEYATALVEKLKSGSNGN